MNNPATFSMFASTLQPVGSMVKFHRIKD